ncbi:hypothetical protein E3N88_40541 [Mikania micrantha]|uniref:Transposase-associated domain-containing protein n=1 Tax=Mikania micrantha TaxID=192012 RepID=A0A5N6LN16_9ASTR|nr:hypothetical protein E3N88_40541 [Mikania micrantha]
MEVDKSWIKLQNRRCPDFLNGLKKFMEITKNHVNGEGKEYCQCKSCANSKRSLQNLATIYAHIHDRDFLQSYTTWVYHGEKYSNASEIERMWASNADNPPLTNNEMFDALDDVIGEQNTYDENVNEYGDGLDTEFDALFKELNTELYPSCNWMSSLNFLAKLMHIKVINKWTDSSFDQLLEFLRVAFSKENKIPASHYEAKKKLRKIGLGYQSIHACINDCALFWKENSLMQNCPVCNESRWVDKNTKGKKVAQKVLCYFPSRTTGNWRVVENVHHRKLWDTKTQRERK